MPRAPFITTCDIYSGPLAAVPNAFVGTFSCRHVIQSAFFLTGPDAPSRVSYITIADYQPVGMWAPGAFNVIPGLSDRVAVPSGTLPQWWVVYTESVVWLSQPLYWRANLVPLDFVFDVGLIIGFDPQVILNAETGLELGSSAIDVGLVVGSGGSAVDVGLVLGAEQMPFQFGLVLGAEQMPFEFGLALGAGEIVLDEFGLVLGAGQLGDVGLVVGAGGSAVDVGLVVGAGGSAVDVGLVLGAQAVELGLVVGADSPPDAGLVVG